MVKLRDSILKTLNKKQLVSFALYAWILNCVLTVRADV